MAVGEVFIGNALSVVDAKSRASLPARFRVTADRRAQRASAPERLLRLSEHARYPCLQGFDPAYEETLLARLQERVAQMADVDALDAFDDEQLEAFGTAIEVGYDEGGRFVLPTPLRKIAGIELGDKALFLGAGETFQIWNTDRFRAAFQDRPRLINALDGLLEQMDERRGRA